MKTKFPLEIVRQAWIDAYFKGAVDWLAHVESPYFFVKRGEVVISKSEQLSIIKKNQKKMPPSDTIFNEKIESMCEHSGWATISGSASIARNGELISEYMFFELWLILNGRWQIASLCYDDVAHDEAE